MLGWPPVKQFKNATFVPLNSGKIRCTLVLQAIIENGYSCFYIKRGRLSLTMFSTLEASAADRKRRGGALVCGALAQGLVIVVAVLLGVLVPQELPLAKHYALVWLPALMPPDPPVAQPPRKVAR